MKKYNDSYVAIDISSYRNNLNFIKWMMTINNISEHDVLNLTEEQYLHGYCEDFALYFAIRYETNLLFLNNEHNLIKVNNYYYDAANTFGTKFLSNLKYVKTSSYLSRLSEVELLKLLIIDNAWKTYNVLKNNIHLIEKI